MNKNNIYIKDQCINSNEQKTESIIDMLNEFESDDIISSDKKDYYINILNYCNLIDSKKK